MDEMAEHAQRFAPIVPSSPEPRAPVALLPAHLATCVAPRRNLCAEFSQLPTDKLLAEAEDALVRLDRAGRPTDHALVAALIRCVRRQVSSGSLWLDLAVEGVADERRAS